jgi:hypothetical protein
MANIIVKDLKQVLAYSIVVCFGLIGNAFNMATFSRRTMRQTSTFQLLLYLSFIDFFVLLVSTTDLLGIYGFDYDIRSLSTVTCKLHAFLTCFLTHLSNIIMMVVSIERVCIKIINKI